MIATMNALREMPCQQTRDGRWSLARPMPGPLLTEVRNRVRTAWFALRGRGVLVLYADQLPVSPESILEQHQ